MSSAFTEEIADVVFLLEEYVTYYNYFIKSFRIFIDYNVQSLTFELHFLCYITNVGNNNSLSISLHQKW